MIKLKKIKNLQKSQGQEIEIKKNKEWHLYTLS